MLCKLFPAIAVIFGFAIAQTCWAQGTGGTTGTNTTTGTGTGTTNTSNQGGSATGFTDGLQLTDFMAIGPEFTRETVFETERVQPFVGASSLNVIHPRSQVEPGSTLGSSGGSGFTFSNSGQNQSRTGAAGFGATGTASQGFTVSRRGIRSALRHAPIAIPAGDVVETRFSSRLIRLPALQNVGSFEMKVENRIATLRGVVASADQKSLIARQAELEPGVDRVVNELEVSK